MIMIKDGEKHLQKILREVQNIVNEALRMN